MLLFFLDLNEEIPISQEKPTAIHEKITQLFKARNFFSFLIAIFSIFSIRMWIPNTDLVPLTQLNRICINDPSMQNSEL
jgi:hypothetical protein